MKTIVLTAPSGTKFRFQCQDIIAGVPLNPVLPANFDNTPNESRSARSHAWWGFPFIQTQENYNTAESDRQKFREYWGGDIRYDVRCLDGGAWDRSTNWGSAGTLDGALSIARSGPSWQLPGDEASPPR